MRNKLLGIDYGAKRVGLAVSDREGKLAFPKGTIRNDSDLLNTIVAYIDNENVEAIVLGQSTDYSGKENPIMKDISRFKVALEARSTIPIYFEPEFLTTAEAKRYHEECPDVDATAAMLLLQSFIDKNSKTK